MGNVKYNVHFSEVDKHSVINTVHQFGLSGRAKECNIK